MLKKRIRRAREAAKLTQSGLAERVGVQPMQVSRWERGEAEPRSSNLEDIAIACGCDAGWLLTGLGPAPDAAPDQEAAEVA